MTQRTPAPELGNYKKGERIFLVTSYDNKGAVKIYDGIVQACGKKVMRLDFGNNAPFWNKHIYSPLGISSNQIYKNKRVTGFNDFFVVRDNPEKYAQEISLECAAKTKNIDN